MPTLTDSERGTNKYFIEHVRRFKRTAGRPKGSQNKFSVSVRQAIEKVFSGLGGWQGMMEWAMHNPDLFYSQIVPRLLPHELAESGHGERIRVIVYGPNAQPLDNTGLVVTRSGQTSHVEPQQNEVKEKECLLINP